jgi:RNA polymerase sigma-70 factor, ECF subfamily
MVRVTKSPFHRYYYWSIVKSSKNSQLNLPIPEEGHLVHQAQSGSSEAFAQLYDAYLQRVYRYVFFRVSDEQTAEDLSSMVFLKAWEGLERYQMNGSPFVAWLYTIAHNTVIDHYRTRKESVGLDEVVPLASADESLDDQVAVNFDLQTMRDVLQILNEEQQQVLTLRFIAELSTEHIAEIMGKREGAVRALQMRALQMMAKHMQERKCHE